MIILDDELQKWQRWTAHRGVWAVCSEPWRRPYTQYNKCTERWTSVTDWAGWVQQSAATVHWASVRPDEFTLSSWARSALRSCRSGSWRYCRNFVSDLSVSIMRYILF